MVRVPPASSDEFCGTRYSRKRDAIGVAVLVLVVCLPISWRLGFYADDWAFFGALSTASERGLAVYFHLLDASFPSRPVSHAFNALLYRLFGNWPLPYHLTIALLISTAAALFYGCLRACRIRRPEAMATSLLFGVLPSYSSVRYWFSASHAILSVLLLFAAFLSWTTARQRQDNWRWVWAGVSLACASAAAFSYGIVLPLLAILALVMSVSAALQRIRNRHVQIDAWLGGAYSILCIAAVRFKQSHLLNPHLVAHPLHQIEQNVRHLLLSDLDPLAYGLNGREALKVNFWTYGLGFPQTFARIVHKGLGAPDIAFAGVIAVIAGAALFWAQRGPRGRAHSPYALIAAGFALLVGGYSIFLLTPQVMFTTTGMANRVCVAGTAGVSLCWAGVASGVSRWRLRRSIFTVVVGLLIFFSVATDLWIGRYWIAAAHAQERILAQLRPLGSSIPPDATVLLGGSCLYVGPAPIFESDWDWRGAIQTQLRRPNLMGDVVSAETHAGRRGVLAFRYGSRFYPYGPRTILFVPGRALSVLRNADVGRVRLEAAYPSSCPDSSPGTGVPLLSASTRPVPAGPPEILRLYPREATAGIGFNVQPSGESAIAVDCTGIEAGSYLLFDGEPLKTTIGNASVVSAVVPAWLLTKGDHTVVLATPHNGKSAGYPFPIR